MTSYTHRMPGICAASGVRATTTDDGGACAARERADRLERTIAAVEWRLAELERLLRRLEDEYREADAVAKAGGE